MKTHYITSDDAAVLKAFELELGNLWDASWEDFRRSFKEALNAEDKKATKFAIAHPGGRVYIDRYHMRAPLHKEHAEKIGKDFLSAFNEVIKPHCKVLTQGLKSSVTKLFYARYQSCLAQIHRNMEEYTASIGRPNDFESHYIPLAGFYSSSQSKYYNLLEAEIAKHNLNAKHSQIDAKSSSAVGDHSSRQTEKHVAPMYDLGRKKHDDIAEYIILRQTIGRWSDLTEGIRWVSQYCRSKGKQLKEASLRRAVSRVNSSTNLNTDDARKKVEEFEKNFGIKVE